MERETLIGIALRLKEFRLTVAKKRTQKDMCSELGISQATYSRYESGERMVSNSTLVLLEEKYGIDREWLLTGMGSCLATYNDEEIIKLWHGVKEGDKRVVFKMLELFSSR